MAVKRLVLDTGILNTDGLDGVSQFLLNAGKLDDATSGLDGGDFLTTATGAAALGGLTASASATVKIPATAAAPLGGLTGSASVTVTIPATAEAGLGGLVSLASATVQVSVTGSAALGLMVATVVTTPVVSASGVASLGGLVAAVVATPSVPASADAPLGGLIASAVVVQPEPSVTPGYLPNPFMNRKKLEPVEQVVIDIPKKVFQPVSVSARGVSNLGSLTARAGAEVRWSILEDEAELLLLV